jgi:YD repeat-containing protein
MNQIVRRAGETIMTRLPVVAVFVATVSAACFPGGGRTYDGPGRLVQASASDGTVRRYEYDVLDELIAVREPGRIVQNWYESGRLTRQEVRYSPNDPDPYVATVRYVVSDGKIVQADFDEGDGVEIRRYNKDSYPVSETFDADGPAPITFTYDRDETTNVVRSATMSCIGPDGRVTRTVPPAANRDDEMKQSLMRETCVPGR